MGRSPAAGHIEWKHSNYREITVAIVKMADMTSIEPEA